MLGRRHEHARLASNFYRDQFRKVLNWLIVSMVLMFILIAAIVYFVLFQPTVHFYANTNDGKILNMPQPKLS